MKRIVISIALGFALSACSLDEVAALLITPTSPPPPHADTATPTVYQTPSNTPTITPTPTFTTTPTLVGANTGLDDEDADTESDYAFDDVLPTLYVVPTVPPAPKTTLYGQTGSIVYSMTISSDMLIWGYCDVPHYVDFDVRLASNLRVKYVLLFMRLVDKGGNQSTAWGGGAIMKKVSGSYYTYRVRPENITHFEEFKDAWVQYQVVVATSSLRSLGRTPVHTESLTLKKCEFVEVDD